MQRLIACVHISNICRIANTITEMATIMDSTVTIFCAKGVSFHFVFISHSAFRLPSLSKDLLSTFPVKKTGTIKVTVFTKLTISLSIPSIASGAGAGSCSSTGCRNGSTHSRLLGCDQCQGTVRRCSVHHPGVLQIITGYDQASMHESLLSS